MSLKHIEAARKKWLNLEYRVKNSTSRGKHWQFVEKIKKKCLHCNKEFKVYPSLKNRMFCSLFCRANSSYFKEIVIRTHKGRPSHWKGKKHSIESRIKLSQAIKGEKHWNWKGGVESENKRIRQSIEFKIWREKVFYRDNYTCWICEQNSKNLHPHHLKRFAEYPELRFNRNNGLTLCEFCHKVYTDFGTPRKKYSKY